MHKNSANKAQFLTIRKYTKIWHFVKRTLTWSEDGSPTLFSETFGETYHSDAGAIEESVHVFLQAGLEAYKRAHPDQLSLHIVEYGFGTGLNVLLTLDQHIQLRNKGIKSPDIHFRTLEKFPLLPEEYEILTFPANEHLQEPERLKQLHEIPWNEPVEIVPGFILLKENRDFLDLTAQDLSQLPLQSATDKMSGFCRGVDVIYFDAFSPGSQPELWEAPIFRTLAEAGSADCTLVTYSARGSVKQALREVGFFVQRLPGAGRKRHMVRGILQKNC